MTTHVPVGEELFDRDGEKIGTIDDVYPDPSTLEPMWFSVKMTVFGAHSVVPVAQVRTEDGRSSMPTTKEHVKSAPSVSGPGGPTSEEEHRLQEHYGWSPDADDTRWTEGEPDHRERPIPLGPAPRQASARRSMGPGRSRPRGRQRPVQVIHREDGRWAVMREGARRASSVHDTKAEAEQRAKSLARREGVAVSTGT